MSSDVYGLRENPFDSALALSADETMRLIQDRVSACGADGPALFPPETCAAIQRRAGGGPDAIWKLAGQALRLASEAGAATVSAAHVRTAARAAQRAAEGAATSSAAAEAAMIATPRRAAPEAQAAPAGAAERATGEAAAPPGGGARATATRVRSIQLPSRPSRHLDRGTREWVARFLGPERPDPDEGAARHSPAPGAAFELVDLEVEAKSIPAPLPSALIPRGRAIRRRRRRRPVGTRVAAIAAPVVAVVAIMLYLLPRGRSDAPRPLEAGRSPAAHGVAGSPTGTDPPAAEPARQLDEPPMSPANPTRERSASSAAATSTAAESHRGRVASAQGAAGSDRSGSPDRAPEAPESGRERVAHGLVVAGYIFESRAREERDRLTAAGHRARVRTDWENGAAIYRVVVGPFATREGAEAAAEKLLSTGLVQQARVIALGRPD